MVWFFIGMPYQDRQSVLDTVAYSERLIRKFGGWKALPLICPMVPFLDPGCRFFEEPEQHGYRIFHRTLEEHRQAMVEPLWHRRLNYETRWLDRRQLQDVSYEAIARLVELKGEYGVLPSHFCQFILKTINDTQELLGEMEAALRLDGRLPAALRDEIRSYNRKILAYSSDQIVPRPAPVWRPLVRRRHCAAADDRGLPGIRSRPGEHWRQRPWPAARTGPALLNGARVAGRG